jgi:DNA-binding PadR family transcriptional regulator
MAEAEPMKAYELIAELERVFGPSYRPSPGGVYPALNALVAERLLATDRDGRGKRYRLTRLGAQALDSRRKQLAALEERTGTNLRDDSSLRPELDRFSRHVMKLSGRVEPHDVARILDETLTMIEKLIGDHDDKH